MIVNQDCWERGCACHDPRVDSPGVEVMKRGWVGLTPDETMHLMNQTAGQHWADEAHIQRFRAALEDTLKEKNT